MNYSITFAATKFLDELDSITTGLLLRDSGLSDIDPKGIKFKVIEIGSKYKKDWKKVEALVAKLK